MVGHNEIPRDSMDSNLPQMSDVVPVDGSLFRPSHARQPSNPNVFSDDYSIDSIDAPLFSHHRRSQSFSSLDSASTIDPRNYNLSSKLGTGNGTQTSLLDQQHNQQRAVPPPEESVSLNRTVSRHSEASTPHNEEEDEATQISDDDDDDDDDEDEEAQLNPFTDEPSSSNATLAGRPSSIRKGFIPLNRQSVVSTTSTRSGYNALPGAMSPYRGATGPSHPYAMYPQVGVSRAASVATVSSLRQVDSPLQGRTAPQHPYGMYPQIVDYETDLGDQPIPVGFSATRGLQQSTSPQADEVGDIVGPDGHLEQLPPYSRYPDGVVRPISAGRGPASIASVMREQHTEPYRDDPTTSLQSDASSGTLINVDSSEPLQPSGNRSDRSSTLVESISEKITEKGRKKCWGAPIWLVVLATLASVICALLGGVIGGVLGERAATRRAQLATTTSASVITVTYTTDVSPYTATPTNIAALPTGSYQIPWSVTNASKFCIGTSNQMASWSCQVLDALPIAIQGSIQSSNITISEPVSPDTGNFNYGAQLPFNVTPSTQKLKIIIDKEDPHLGPALFFQTLFDKLVIVEDSSNMRSKRSLDARNGGTNEVMQGQQSARPWYCWWNDTQIETFIYINQTDGSTKGSSSSSSQSAVSTTTAASGSGTSKRDYIIAGDYPRKIKIKENRVNPNAPQAYCQQMQVNADNSVTAIQGQYFKINESITTQPYSSQKGQTPCYCEWFN